MNLRISKPFNLQLLFNSVMALFGTTQPVTSLLCHARRWLPVVGVYQHGGGKSGSGGNERDTNDFYDFVKSDVNVWSRYVMKLSLTPSCNISA